VQTRGIVPGFEKGYRKFERHVVLKAVDQLWLQCGIVVISFRTMSGVCFGRRNLLLPVSQGSRRTGVRELHQAYRIGTGFFNNPLNLSPDGLPSYCLKITRLSHKDSHSEKRRESETKTKHQKTETHKKNT